MSDADNSSLQGGGSQNQGGIHESETARLQREVDDFTVKLEQERHRLLTLEQQIKQVEQELKEKAESN
jgi:low affinity Fe/Cu permease